MKGNGQYLRMYGIDFFAQILVRPFTPLNSTLPLVCFVSLCLRGYLECVGIRTLPKFRAA